MTVTLPTARKSGAFQRLLDGTNVKVVCLPGTSQYTQGAGGSSCGLACLNAIRVVYALEGTGVQLLEQMNRPETIRACLAICASWGGEAHLEVDDISKLPLFEASLNLRWTNYGKPEDSAFARMLRKLATEVKQDACIALVLTRPPEMTAVFCIPVPMAAAHVQGDSGRPNDQQQQQHPCVYAVFDSHPRPIVHPDGAAFIFFRDAASAAAYLADLLRVDAALFASGALQWQAQLLAQFSAHCFAAKKTAGRLDLVKHAYDVNMSLMDLRLRLADVDGEMRKVLQENDRLKKQLERERERSRALLVVREQEKQERGAGRSFMMEKDRPLQAAVPSPSKAPFSVWGTPGGSRQTSAAARPLWDLLPPASPTATSSLANQPERPSLSDLPSPIHSTHPTPHKPRNANATSPQKSADKAARATSKAKPRQRDRQRDDRHRESDFDLAARLQADEQEAFLAAERRQARYDAEDARLRAERDALAATMAQKTFDCAVCMDTWAEDNIARVDGCGHALCRPCMLQYIQSALRDKSFPIVCPICKADKRKEGEHSTIAPSIVENIGLREGEFAVWNELQIAGFSVEIECRKCKQKAAVDREDYNTSPWISCPMPGCHYIWCKKCNQEIPLGPVNHSCDGSKEFDHLMKKSGWRYCPGCNTPCEKIEGCNHMTCQTPGCNTHFCYKCGVLIVKSSTAPIINTHLGLHYARCALFDNVPE